MTILLWITFDDFSSSLLIEEPIICTITIWKLFFIQYLWQNQFNTTLTKSKTNTFIKGYNKIFTCDKIDFICTKNSIKLWTDIKINQKRGIPSTKKALMVVPSKWVKVRALLKEMEERNKLKQIILSFLVGNLIQQPRCSDYLSDQIISVENKNMQELIFFT